MRHVVKVTVPCPVCRGWGKAEDDSICRACAGSGEHQRGATVEERLDYLEDQLDGFGDEVEYDLRGTITNVREL